MIPPFDPATGNLPPGMHEAAWGEVAGRFGTTEHRQRLLACLHAALIALRVAGCRREYLDGSFVTAKLEPGDFDACWEMAGVDFDRLAEIEPVLLEWRNLRAAQKEKFRGECFIAEATADLWGTTYLEFFQRDRDTNAPKGILAIDLGALS